MRITKTKLAAIGSAAAVIALSGGAAMAYWTTTGSGDGSAQATTSAAVNAVQDSAFQALAPAQSGAIKFHLDNTAAFPQYVSQVTITVANPNGSAWTSQANVNKPACSAADFTITQPAAINANVPAGAQAPNTYSASIAMTNRADTVALDGLGNQDNCKGVTVPLHYAVG